MSGLPRSCAWHPERRPIGVCVITGKAICAECSTRYEGVNYSKEGLAILQAQRAAEAGRVGPWERLVTVGALAAAPLLLALMYVFYLLCFETMIDLQQDVERTAGGG